MNILYDKEKIDKLLNAYGLPEIFNCEPLNFHIRTYQAGELISSPGEYHHSLLFLREEDVELCWLFEDGNQATVGMPGLPLLILGDFEFVTDGPSAFYTKAQKDVTALCLPFKENRELLKKDPDFLCFLLRQVTYKTLIGRRPYVLQNFPLRERVLSLMRHSLPDYSIRGVEETASQLGCSSRQLLRILNDLIREGLVEKTGRGCYHLLNSTRG